MKDSEGSAFRNLWDLGYDRLVPVVPVDAEVGSKGALRRRLEQGEDPRGKAPGVRRGDIWTGFNFVAMESQESDLDTWNSWGASTGIKTGHGLIAVDIDTLDRKAAQKLYELAAQTLGPAHVRFGQKPKCLLLYRAPEDTAYQWVQFSTPTDPKPAKVEILAEGRQFVASGTHPKTREPYVWPNGIPRRDQLSEITAEQLDAFLQAAAEQLPESRRSGTQKDAPDAREQDELRAPSWEALESTVTNIPNTSHLFATRDDYIAMAYAIKAAAPEGYEIPARDLYLDWCDRWVEGENAPGVAMEDWARAKPPFRVGYEFLQSHAVDAFFEPQTDVTDDMFIAQEADKPKGYNLLTIDDVFSLPPPKFLIDRYLPETGLGILYGDPGTGKSFIALDQALHIAYGLDTWHGDVIHAKDRGAVLYIAGEGSSGFRARVKAWQAQNLTEETAHRKPDIRFLFEPISFMRPDDIRRLIASVTAAGMDQISMVVVDTVSRSIAGADENLQKDMTIFIAACDAIRIKTGAFVLGVHHTAKTGTMRGSSVFAGQADVVLKLTRQKGASVGRLMCEKQKDAPDGWQDAYRLDTITTPEGTTSLVPVRLDAPEAASATADHTLKTRILTALQEAWEAGTPWTMAPQAKARYAPKIIARDFEIPAEVAAQWLSIWEDDEKIIRTEERDAKRHLTGLCLSVSLDEIGLDRAGAVDSLSGQSVFD